MKTSRLVSTLVCALGLVATGGHSQSNSWSAAAYQGRATIGDPMETGAPRGTNCTLEVVGKGMDRRSRPQLLGRLFCPAGRKRFSAEMPGTLNGCQGLGTPEVKRGTWSDLGFIQGGSAAVQAQPDGSLALKLSSVKMAGCSADFELPAVQKLKQPGTSGRLAGNSWASQQKDWSSVSFRTRVTLADGNVYIAEIVPLGGANRVEVRLFGMDGKLWRRGQGKVAIGNVSPPEDESAPFRWESLGFDTRSQTSAQLMADGSVRFLSRSTKAPGATIEASLPAIH